MDGHDCEWIVRLNDEILIAEEIIEKSMTVLKTSLFYPFFSDVFEKIEDIWVLYFDGNKEINWMFDKEIEIIEEDDQNQWEPEFIEWMQQKIEDIKNCNIVIFINIFIFSFKSIFLNKIWEADKLKLNYISNSMFVESKDK